MHEKLHKMFSNPAFWDRIANDVKAHGTPKQVAAFSRMHTLSWDDHFSVYIPINSVELVMSVISTACHLVAFTSVIKPVDGIFVVDTDAELPLVASDLFQTTSLDIAEVFKANQHPDIATFNYDTTQYLQYSFGKD